MQYVGRAIGTVSKTWNSINPSTLSGAIDVIVVERESGELHCSAFHIRFGKFALLRPTHKGVDFWVNGEKVDAQMKLGEGGEAFFVFETEADVPESMLTSPVMSPAGSPRSEMYNSDTGASDEEVDYLDLGSVQSAPLTETGTSKSEGNTPSLDDSNPGELAQVIEESDLFSKETHDWIREQDPRRIDELVQRLSEVNIPSTKNDNGEVIIDMTGYKPGGQNTEELENVVQQILSHDLQHAREGEPPDAGPFSEAGNDGHPEHFSEHERSEGESPLDVTSVHSVPLGVAVSDGSTPLASPPRSPLVPSASERMSPSTSPPGSPSSMHSTGSVRRKAKHFVKTLRLTSEMLKRLNLKRGQNSMKFQVRDSKATVTASIFYWSADTPVVVSDIDGTITRSDALGHVMTMIGRDWTHQGVSRLFTDIERNGYNIMYLTSRAVGQADITRGYLHSIEQEGYTLPKGPVILSPDRTIAALHREVIMRKPEIFKMACLRDIGKLYNIEGTPFYAGFGNRITDALSYRSVGVPSTKIFTINSNSEVHMELLELTGYKSSYMLISDLVDHFFPPFNAKSSIGRTGTMEFTDVNFWKAPMAALSDDESHNSGASDYEYNVKLTATFGQEGESDSGDDEDEEDDDEEEDEDDDDDDDDEEDDEDEDEDDYGDEYEEEFEDDDHAEGMIEPITRPKE